MCMKHDFLNTYNSIKQEPDDLSKYVKFLINYLSRPKLENCYLNRRKNLVTTTFFEQRIKEKLNTQFDYYLWKGCLWSL